MKKIFTLLFAVMAFFMSAGAQSYTCSKDVVTDLSDLTAEGAMFAMAVPSSTNYGEFFNGAGKKSTTFADEHVYTLESAGEDTYYLKRVTDGAYVPVATATSCSLEDMAWSTDEAAIFTVQLGVEPAMTDATVAMDDWARLVRFTTTVDNAGETQTILNAQGSDNTTCNYRTGRGGWSGWLCYLVTEGAPTEPTEPTVDPEEPVEFYASPARVTKLEAGKKYMLFNTCYTSGEYANRYGVFFYDGAVKTYGGALSGSFKTTDPNYVFTVTPNETPNTYTLHSVGQNADVSTNMEIMPYLDSEVKCGPDVNSKDAAGDVTMGADFTAEDALWAIRDLNHEDTHTPIRNCWNGNNWYNKGDNCFAYWSTAHPVAIYEVFDPASLITEIDLVQAEGDFYRYGAVSSGFCSIWQSASEDPQISLSVTSAANNMSSSNWALYTGAGKNCQYDLTISEGYRITGYSVTFKNATAGFNQSITPAGGEEVATTADGEEVTVTVKDIQELTTSFALKGENKGAIITEFLVSYIPVTSATATFTVKDGNGVVVAEGSKNFAPGEKLTLPAELQRAFCEYEMSATEMGAEDMNVEVTYTFNPPFTVSENFETAKWYYLTLKNQNYLYWEEGASSIKLDRTSVSKDASESWAFMGDPYKGITILNKLAGPEASLNYGTDDENTIANDGNTGANTHPILAEGNEQVWIISASSHMPNGFFLGTAEKNFRMNNRASLLSYWTTGADMGSTFAVMEIPSTSEEIAKVKEQIAAYLVNAGKIAYLTTEAAGEFQSQLDALTGDDDMTLENAKLLLSDVQSSTDYVLPTDGYYRFRTRANDLYLSISELTGRVEGISLSSLDTSTATVWTVTDNGDGTYGMTAQGLSFPEFTANNLEWNGTDVENTVSFEIPTPGYLAIKVPSTDEVLSYAHCNPGTDKITEGYTHQVVRWNAVSNPSQWIAEEATDFTLNFTVDNMMGDNCTYAPVCLPFPVTLDETEVKNGTLNFSTVAFGVDGLEATVQDGNVIPANTPVIVCSKEAAFYTNVTIGGTAGEMSSDLTGALVAMKSTPENARVLGIAEDGMTLAFITPEAEGIDANTAYFVAPEAETAEYPVTYKSIETGIDNVKTATFSGRVYDLQGRRVLKAQKGLYIVNGKKMVK